MADLASTLEDELGIDGAALRARYRLERDRRLRTDGVAQFVPTTGSFAVLADDPWVEPGFTREAVRDEVNVLVIGGGLGAILAGAELRRAGVDHIRFVERAGGFGGVWYWNRYPGAACDTQAILYLPMLEELGILPPRKFASQPEILAHLERIAARFDLHRDTLFQTDVTGLSWDENAARWIVATDRGDTIRARYVVIPSGPMDRPKLPGIPGIERFRGHSFHTSRWDYGYTGGTQAGGMTGLADKAVGIIGTGATAVQVIPHIAASARHLYVFQRTPSSIDAKDDGPLDPQAFADLEPGWQQRLWDNFTALTGGTYLEEDLVRDGWTSIMANICMLLARSAARGERVADPLALHQLADFMKMEAIRARVSDSVADAAVAAALQPWYDRFCKRPCFSDTYLNTFNRTNVTLVDTAGQGVERITEDAIVVDGRSYPVDCLIYGTGFETSAPFARRLTYPIVGRGGVSLARKWAAGASTLHGMATNGFPNLFILSVTQSGVSLNFAHMIQEQAKHLAYILGRAVGECVTRVEVTEEAENAWVAELARVARDQEAFQRECTPSYFNAEGDLTRINRRNGMYGGGALAFYRIIANWRADGGMQGYVITRGE
ncbi:NAD(P)/FAD-dependent oxidoreductase [uncultured Sphingomonas sp.]|uniref:flavin-containing monooxygenase n=1 Tax=uncultured Sphingomonas sp. TaxID=158754 RepID=UPI00260ABB21|nr:NAD(P)/FAD-dependent oxidoreductase [uncultured Sphingomonas sp.]